MLAPVRRRLPERPAETLAHDAVWRVFLSRASGCECRTRCAGRARAKGREPAPAGPPRHPPSRSTRTMASATSTPVGASASRARKADPPVVTTSSTEGHRSPLTGTGPAILAAVPCTFSHLADHEGRAAGPSRLRSGPDRSESGPPRRLRHRGDSQLAAACQHQRRRPGREPRPSRVTCFAVGRSNRSASRSRVRSPPSGRRARREAGAAPSREDGHSARLHRNTGRRAASTSSDAADRPSDTARRGRGRGLSPASATMAAQTIGEQVEGDCAWIRLGRLEHEGLPGSWWGSMRSVRRPVIEQPLGHVQGTQSHHPAPLGGRNELVHGVGGHRHREDPAQARLEIAGR